MNKMIRTLFALALAACMMLSFAVAENAAPEAAATAYKNTAIVIDGDLSEWNTASPLVIDGGQIYDLEGGYKWPAQSIRDGFMWTGVNDLSATAYVAWDETYLYIGAVITENTPYGSIEMLPMDGQDNIQLYISTNPADDPARTAYSTTDFKVTVLMYPEYWDNAIDRTMVSDHQRYVTAGMDGGEDTLTMNSEKNGGQPFQVGTKTCVTENGTGFTWEAAIPWAAFANENIAVYTPVAGDAIKFDYVLTDIDYPCPGTEYIPQLAWTHNTQQIDTNPSQWGTLTFAE